MLGNMVHHRIYTSYFGNIKNIKIPVEFVNISRYPPKWFVDMRFKSWQKLAPSSRLLYFYKYKNLSKDDYTKTYLDELRYNIEDVNFFIEYCEEKKKDFCFLCYETPEKFCHRHIFANWVNSFNILRYPICEY